MGTVYDYLDWRGDLTFAQAPLNEVDSLIFSMISYLDFEGIVPAFGEKGSVTLLSAADGFFSQNPDLKKYSAGVLIPKEIVKLLRQMKDTARFRDVEMRAFVNLVDVEREIQFCAMTCALGEGTTLVVYRGTDDTLVGWKEDLNMSFLPVVPAQEEAVAYLERIARGCRGRIALSGHSKGGNLAVYAAVHSKKRIRFRIVDVFSHDGPGFGKRLIDDPAYLSMRPVIHSIVPQSSIVGFLLEHDENYTVVKSRQRSGFLQHNGLSWEILGGSFVHMEEISAESRRTDRTLKQWLGEMTPSQREEFCEAIYQLFSVDGAETLTDLGAARKKWLAHSKSLDPKVHETVQKMFSFLIALNAKNMIDGIFRKNEGKDTPKQTPTES